MAFDPTGAYLDEEQQPKQTATVGGLPKKKATTEHKPFDPTTAVLDEDADQGVLGTLWQGTKSAARAVGATANTYTGNEQGAVRKAEAQQEAPKDHRLEKFYNDVERNTEATKADLPEGEDVGVLDAIGNVASAVADNPAGAGLAVVEQLPNSAPAMAGGFAGFKAGGAAGAAIGTAVFPGVGTAIGGTAGAILGGLAGMFLGNALIETGHKAMEAAGDGAYTPEEMSQVKREGATKAGVITAVDGVTLGLGGAVSGAMQRTTRSALESATRKALVDKGVDVTSEAAVQAARQSPEISAAVRAAQDSAIKATDTLKRRAAEAGVLLGMETVGEGVGEYLGELAATGEANVTDAVMESLLSLGQSSVEAGWNMRRNQQGHPVWEPAPTTVQPMPTADNPNPAPVERPDPANGPLSAAASLLPTHAPVLDAARIEQELSQPAGQATAVGGLPGRRQATSEAPQAPADPAEARIREAIADVERRARLGGMTPTLAAERARLGGELVALQEQRSRRAVTDQGQPGFAVDAVGNAVPARVGTPPHRNYVQGGRGMDQQTPMGQPFTGQRRSQAAGGELTTEATGARPVLQNRDRSTPAYVEQMHQIASRPDYGRLGFSRDFTAGAPVIEPGASIPRNRLGKTDIAVTATGRHIPVQYAVVEAADLLPSNNADGTSNTAYSTGVAGKSRAIAGNGRVAGLQLAYRKGNMTGYRRALAGDDMHGISPSAIEGMRDPVLVRVMPQDQITPNIGDESNTSGTAGLSPAEAAHNDARRINLDGLTFGADGSITDATLLQFIQAMPEGERSTLLDGGVPNRQARDRLESAIFAMAYESDELVRLQSQASDPDARTVLSGLVIAAPKMARLKGAGNLDIRGLVVEAAGAAVNARRQDRSLQEYAATIDLDRNPETQPIIEMFAANSRSPKRIGEQLSALADTFYAEASKPETDMLGAVPKRSREELLGATDEGRTAGQPENPQAAGDAAGAADDARGDEGATEPAEPDAAAQPQDFQLTPQTEQELAEQASQQEAQRKAEDEARRKEAEKAQADAERDTFALTGSSRPADVAAARGQADIFAAQPTPAQEPTADIRAITAKQIPDMTDDELERAIAHYGPDHKRTAKLRKEQEKRAQAQQPAATQPAGEQKPKSLKEGIEKIRQQKAAATESTAPEHAMVGVDDRELDEIVSEFNEAHEEMRENGIHHLFDKPAKGDVVRLAEKVKVYHAEHGWMTPAEARAKINEWKASAQAQGENERTRNQNAGKVVLSLFDKSGAWSRPWEEAGYQVYRFDIQDDPVVGDVNNFSTDFFGDWFGDFEGADIYAILAACPCTDFASSGARHFAAKDQDGRTVASVRLVHQALRTIEYFRPAVWALENPVGRIEKLGGLPPWRLAFDPNHLGDPYTKKTLIWGRFNGDLPIAPEFPSEGSKMHSQYGGKSLATKNARSVTPEGFAYGFFAANNAIDHPEIAIGNKYDRLDKRVIADAVKAGMTEGEIGAVVDDHYYMDLNDDAANQALRDAVAARAAEAQAAAPASTQAIERAPAPGTRFNTDADREAADRLELVAQELRDSKLSEPEIGAVRNIESVVEELRRPRTVVSVQAVLEQAAPRLNRQFSALADVVYEVAEQLGQPAEQAAERTPRRPQPGEDGYTLLDARNDLMEVRAKVESQGMVKDGRDVERVRKFEALVKHMEAEQAAAQQPASAPEQSQGEDLDAMFDDVLAEVTEASAPAAEPAIIEDEPAAAPAKRTRSPRAQQPEAAPEATQRSAGEALASAGKNAAAALDDAINGLGALFGGHGRFGSGLTFDEETYAKAKPLFASAVVNLKNASADLRDAMRAVVSMVVERFGAEAAQNMKPYVVRFIADVRDGTVELGAQDDTRRNAAGDDQPLAPVPPLGLPETREGSAETSDGLRAPDAAGNGRLEEDRSGRGNRLDGGEAPVLSDGAAETGSATPGQLNPREDAPNALAGENPGNFTITEDFALGEGSAGRKIEANLQAIRTLRKIQQENRYATPDEQAIMARYVGWGGLKSVFDPKKADATDMYGRAQRELKQLLSKPEYDDAFDSVRNAHYTAKGVVDAMWRLARHMGFNGGRVLEPTVGIGNFIGLQPADLAAASEWHASELDYTTGSMAKHLYPNANVLAGTGFQDAKFANGVFDLAIGNPPFGAQRVTDRSKNRSHLNGMKIHNYVIAKTGLHLRPGGVMAMVVTHRFLDTADEEARSVLAKDFKFLGAIRLPNDAFRQNAGTDVVTDIVILQKYREGEAREKSPAWLDVNGTIEVDGKQIRVNRYFEQNPSHILGRSAMDGTMYAGRRDEEGQGEYTVHGDGRDLGQTIDELMGSSLADIAGAIVPTNQDRDVAAVMLHQSELPVGGMRLSEDGRIERRDLDDAEGNAVVQVITPDSLWKDQAQEWLAVRDAVIELRDTARQRRLTHADFAELAEHARFTLKADGKPKSSPTKAEQAVYTLVEAGERPELFAWRFDAELAEIEASLARKKLGQKSYEALRGMLDLRNRTLALIRAEMADAKGHTLMRASLNKAYDEFVAKHGYLSDPANFNLLGGDVGAEAGLEAAYEPEITLAVAKASGIPPRKASAKKADILTKRVNFPRKEITTASSPRDALDIALSERGRVDLAFMAQLLDMPVAEVIADLVSGDNPRLFRNPETDGYEDAESYLSGNVRHKLEAARRAGLQANVKALEAVQPAPKAKHQIRPSIRGQWMPASVFTDFLNAMGVRSSELLVVPNQGILKAFGTVGELSEFGAQFAHPDRSVLDLFNAAASGKSVTITRTDGKVTWKDEEATKSANAIVARMSKVFEDFAYADEARAESIVEAFNERMNTHTPRVYNGEKYLRTVGASPSIKLRRTQKNGAWRMVLSKTMLADHVVGAGKTFTAIAGVMERRRLGLSRKPMIAVPNHLVVQWARDFYKMYPGAKVLAATPADFAKKNRRRLMARIATGDYDAIIVGHTSIGFIDNHMADHEAIIQENLSALEEAMEQARQSGESKRTLGQMRDRVEKYREKLTALSDRTTDEIGIDFKALGVDYLVVDEAHEFKNLEYATSGERVVGMNDPNGSKRAFDLYVKVRGLLDREGGVSFLTGTPVSNSLVEIYTMMRYLAHDELKLRDQEHFDAWSGAYAATDTKLEYTATQKLKPRRVLAGLNNLSALRQLYEHFADIITMADLKRIYAEEKAEQNRQTGANERTDFPIPKVKGGKRALDTGDITEAQSEYMDYLVARMKKIESMKGQEARDYAKIDNALNVLTDARKMSLDIRVVDPNAPRDENGKVMRAARNIKAVYDKWDDVRGTQMVFCDLSTPAKAAAKNARTLIKDTSEVLFGKGQAAQVRRQLEGKTYAEQWAWLNEQAAELIDNENLSQDKRDQIETYLAELEDADATVLTADIGFSVYDDLRAVLVEQGIPESEIAFIHDFNTPEQKEKLFDRMNNGYIRVLLGSSAKMGAGTNAQKRLVALHHMDAPWRPSDVEQREGRIIRQGNLFYQAVDLQDTNGLPPDIVEATRRLRGEYPNGFEVEITAYSTNGTSDTVMWQILERKAGGIEQFRNGGLDSLEEESSDSDQYAEFMATSTGNPIFRYKLEAERAYTELEAEVSGTRIAKANAQGFLRDLPRKLRDAQENIDAFEGKTVATATYGKHTGTADEYQAAMDAAMADFDAKFAEWIEQKAEADAAIAAWEKAPEAARGAKPATPTRPVRPNLLSKAVQDKSGFARAIAAAMAAVRPDGPSVTVNVGDGLAVELRGDKGISSNLYTAILRNGASYVTLERSSLGANSKATDSPNLLKALEPAAINGAAEQLVAQRKETIRNLEARRPKQEQLAALTLDESKVDEARKLMEWYQHQVRFAEERAEVERSRRRNRYIPRDRRRFPGWEAGDGRMQDPVPDAVEVDGVRYETTGYRSGLFYEATRASDGLPVILAGKLNEKFEVNGFEVIEQPEQLREEGAAEVLFSRKARPTGATAVRFLDRGTVQQLAIEAMGESVVRDRFVFARYDDLPAEIRAAAAKQGAKPHEVDAVFSHGKTYIVDDRFRTAADARKAIFHEHYVHYGLRAKYGRGLALKLAHLMRGLGGLDGVRRMAKEQGIDLSAYEKGILGNPDIPKAHQPLILTEELLAHIGETTGTLKRMLQEAIGAIRAWLRDNGWASLAKLGITDIAHVLRQARKAARDEDGTPPDLPRLRVTKKDQQTNTPEFRRWFGDSKTVDRQGEPLTLYHGTAAEFTIFEDRSGAATGHSTSALGYFMTSDRRSAEGYARNASDGMPGLARVMELYATIRNPYTATMEEMQAIESTLQARTFRSRLEQAGYDGIHIPAGKVWVAFSNTQIKSATDNVGTFDEIDPDIRFRRSAADTVGQAIASITVPNVKRSAKARLTDFLGVGLQTLGRRQLVDLYDGLLPLRRYDRLVERMGADINDIGAQADELARRWGKVKDSDKLADLMHDATLAQIDADPSKPADEDANASVRDALVARFNALSPEAQAIYREARDAYKDHHRSVIEAIRERIKRSQMSDERKADLMRQMEAGFYWGIKGVYFPLARFGKYVVAVSGPDGKIESVHRAETMGEANALRDQLIQRFPKEGGYDVGKVTLDKEFVASRDSVSRGFMAELFGALEGMDLPASQRAELEDTLGQLYLASMPDLSWAKHGIHRKGTAGFSDDARRAFAQKYVSRRPLPSQAALWRSHAGRARPHAEARRSA